MSVKRRDLVQYFEQNGFSLPRNRASNHWLALSQILSFS